MAKEEDLAAWWLRRHALEERTGKRHRPIGLTRRNPGG